MKAVLTLSLFPFVSKQGHTEVPLTDPNVINDPSPVTKPRYLKNVTEFSLIEDKNEESTVIEDFKDDKVVSVGGTYSTWIDKETGQYFLYVRPVLLSEDKPDRVTIFAQIDQGDMHQSTICDMYTRADLVESPT